ECTPRALPGARTRTAQGGDPAGVGRKVAPEPAVGARNGGAEKSGAPERAPAVHRVLRLAVVLGGARGQLVAGQPRRRLEHARVGSRHAIFPSPAAGRRAVTQRQVSTWCSSIMLSKGSFMKICCDCGPTTLSATQYFTPSRSSSLRVSWMSATASATCESDGSWPGPFANFDWPFTPIRWICAVPPTSIQ